MRRLNTHPNIVRFLGASAHFPPRLLAGPTPGAPDEAVQGVTLAIVMELCRCGSLFRVLDYARRVARLPPGVRSGAAPPRTTEEAKLKVRRGF
jgi:serine/threonine protein kinase